MSLFIFSVIKLNLAVYLTVKAEKKTVQFSDEVQVETIEPEPEPVYIDEVSVVKILIGAKCTTATFKCVMFNPFILYFRNMTKREWKKRFL